MSTAMTKALLGASRRLASLGHYRAATRLLDALAATEAAPDSQLLRAKILAQQGALDDAAACWDRVLAIDPQNTEAHRGLALRAALAGRRLHPVRVRRTAWRTAVWLASAVLMVAIAYDQGRRFAGASAADLREVRQQAIAARDRFQSLDLATRERDAELEGAMRDLRARLAVATDRIAADFAAVSREFAETRAMRAELARLSRADSDRKASLEQIATHAAGIRDDVRANGSSLEIVRSQLAKRERAQTDMGESLGMIADHVAAMLRESDALRTDVRDLRASLSLRHQDLREIARALASCAEAARRLASSSRRVDSLGPPRERGSVDSGFPKNPFAR